MDEWGFANETLTVSRAAAISSLAIGIVFGYAAIVKLLDMAGFVAGLQLFSIVPSRLAHGIAGLLAGSEMLISLAHISGFALHLIVPGTIVLLALFLVVTGNVLRRGEKRSCFCFGTGRDGHIDRYSVIRIILLLTVESLLFVYLIVGEEPMLRGETSLIGLLCLLEAAIATALVSWILALPKVLSSYRAIRS